MLTDVRGLTPPSCFTHLNNNLPDMLNSICGGRKKKVLVVAADELRSDAFM
jgi:hypothetical protein